jgi:signal transduction histidine kinase
MQTKGTFYLVLLLFFTLFGTVGIYNLSLRPALPLQLTKTTAGFIILPESQNRILGFTSKDTIEAINSFKITDWHELDEIIDRKKIGQTVDIHLRSGGLQPVILTARNSNVDILLNALLGLSFIIISSLVWFRSTHEGERYFAICALFFGYILALGSPGIQLPFTLSLFLAALYFLSYPQAFLYFLTFAFHFPSQAISTIKLRILDISLHFSGLIFSIILFYLYYLKLGEYSAVANQNYHLLYSFFRAYILVILLLALVVIAYNYSREPNPVNLRKVQWIIGGVGWGGFPFLFLWNLPQIFDQTPLIPEWVFMICLLIIPFSVAIAILRYRLFDIEIILSRSIIYFLVLGCLIILYGVIVGGISLLVHQQISIYGSPFISLIAAVTIALMFSPLKNKVQQQVNRKFFRIRYDRFQILQEFMNNLEHYKSKDQVIEGLDFFFQKSIPLEDRLFLIRQKQHWKEWQAEDPSTRKWVQSEKINIQSHLVINEKYPEKFELHSSLDKYPLPERWIIFIPLTKNAMWFLGEKRSRARFWKEDIDLMNEMSHAAALQIEKMEYLELSIKESLKKKQAQKISEWKTLVLSEVAHDLRAPLNTMLWKLRNLQEELEANLPAAEKPVIEIKEQIYKLQRLIQHLLTLSHVEKGTFPLSVRPTNIRQQISATLNTLSGNIAEKHITIQLDCDPGLMVQVDPEIFQQILFNIIENALKFSPDNSMIVLKGREEMFNNQSRILVEITDQAGGISSDKLKNIFQPFRQSKKKYDQKEGFHLGLYIVKEFMDILKGEIKISSLAGEGTTVQLYFSAGDKLNRKDISVQSKSQELKS